MRRFLLVLIAVNVLLLSSIFGTLLFGSFGQQGALAKIEYINSIQSSKSPEKSPEKSTEESNEAATLLVLGDSTVAYAINPKIGIDRKVPVLSLALPGTTMVTARKELIRYLHNHPAPKCLMISTGNEPEIYGVNFWRLHSSLGLFTKSELKEIYETSEKLAAFPASEMSLPKFLRFEFLFRYFFFTVKSQLELREALGISGQLEKNINLHREYISKTHGHAFRFGENSTQKKTPQNDYLYRPYVENESELKTFLEILRIANEHSIKVIYSLWPVLKSEGQEPIDYAIAHEKYLRTGTMSAENLSFFQITKDLSAEDFRDVHHLNRTGAAKFSDELFSRLPDYCRMP